MNTTILTPPATRVALPVARAIAMAIAAVLTTAAPTRAQTEADAEQLFEQATDAIGRGEIAQAADLLENSLKAAGSERIAAEALFLVGELYEEQLDRPTDAAKAYRRIRAQFPDSRVAVAAGRRLESLEPMLDESGDSAELLARFFALRRSGDEDHVDELLARADALLAEDPSWISAPRVRLWMAGVALRDERRDRAEALYLAATESPDTDVVFEARLAAASLQSERGAYRQARETAEAIDPGGVAGRLQAKRDILGRIERAKARAGLAVYALIFVIAIPFLLLLVVANKRRSVRGFLGALWPPPIEAIYLIPVLAVFIAAAYTGHLGIARAVVLVSAVGAAVTWIAGAALRVMPRSWTTSIAIGACAAIAVAASFYLALVRGGLIDLMIATIRFGPDV